MNSFHYRQDFVRNSQRVTVLIRLTGEFPHAFPQKSVENLFAGGSSEVFNLAFLVGPLADKQTLALTRSHQLHRFLRQRGRSLNLFFGQATQRDPLGTSFSASIGKRCSNPLAVSLNTTINSRGFVGLVRIFTFGGSLPKSWTNAFGALTTPTVKPSLIPNFLMSGVPEYPAILALTSLRQLPKTQ
jgi:hypothetical protein